MGWIRSERVPFGTCLDVSGHVFWPIFDRMAELEKSGQDLRRENLLGCEPMAYSRFEDRAVIG